MTEDNSIEAFQTAQMIWCLNEGICHPYHWAYMKLCAAAGVEPIQPVAMTFREHDWTNQVKNEIVQNPQLKAKVREMRDSFWSTLQTFQREQSATERACVCGAKKFVKVSTYRSYGMSELNLPSGLRSVDVRVSLSGLSDDQQLNIKMCLACSRVQNVNLDRLRRQVDMAEAAAFVHVFEGHVLTPYMDESRDCFKVVERRYRWVANRTRAAEICQGLQSLELPVLILHHVLRADNDDLEASDEYFRTNQVCETVRHFHQRGQAQGNRKTR